MKKSIVPYLIGLILIILPVMVFIVRFRYYSFSDNPKDWIDFSGFYFGMIGLLLTGLIAYLVNKINIRNSKVGLQFEAYKEIVNILTRLTDSIKPMNKTNQEIDDLICETLRQTTHFWQNYLFIFDDLDRKMFIEYEKDLITILNEFRQKQKDLTFGIDGNHGALIINKTNKLLFQIQKIMIQ
jgi:hypothetical protein